MKRDHLSDAELTTMSEHVASVRFSTGAPLESVRGIRGHAARAAMPEDIELLIADIRLYQAEIKKMIAALREGFDDSGFCALCRGHHYGDLVEDPPCPVREMP